MQSKKKGAPSQFLVAGISKDNIDSSSDDSSSSYESPQIDSDELAMLDEEQSNRLQKRKSGQTIL